MESKGITGLHSYGWIEEVRRVSQCQKYPGCPYFLLQVSLFCSLPLARTPQRYLTLWKDIPIA
jgi:hypothetical protein